MLYYHNSKHFVLLVTLIDYDWVRDLWVLMHLGLN